MSFRKTKVRRWRPSKRLRSFTVFAAAVFFFFAGTSRSRSMPCVDLLIQEEKNIAPKTVQLSSENWMITSNMTREELVPILNAIHLQNPPLLIEVSYRWPIAPHNTVEEIGYITVKDPEWGSFWLKGQAYAIRTEDVEAIRLATPNTATTSLADAETPKDYSRIQHREALDISGQNPAVSMARMMAEYNEEAYLILSQLRVKKGGVDALIHLDDMNIRGDQIVVAFQEFAGWDYPTLIKAAKDHDPRLVDYLNEHMPSQYPQKAMLKDGSLHHGSH